MNDESAARVSGILACGSCASAGIRIWRGFAELQVASIESSPGYRRLSNCFKQRITYYYFTITISPSFHSPTKRNHHHHHHHQPASPSSYIVAKQVSIRDTVSVCMPFQQFSHQQYKIKQPLLMPVVPTFLSNHHLKLVESTN
jgi:hypothetical protein